MASCCLIIKGLTDNSVYCLSVSKIAGLISFLILFLALNSSLLARTCILSNISAISTSFNIYKPLIAIFIISY
jgi:hypothetical protein